MNFRLRNAGLLMLAGAMLLAAPVRGLAVTSHVVAMQSAEATTPADSTTKATAAEPEDEHDQYRINWLTRDTAKILHVSPRLAAELYDLLNFAVLAGLIIWFLRGKLPAFFRNRTESLQQQLVEARKATQEANERLHAIEQRLSKLDDEIVGMQQNAEHAIGHEEERFRDMLSAEKERIVTAAEQEIGNAGDAARRNLKLFAAELAIHTAEQRLTMTPELDQKMMDEFLENLAVNSTEGKK